MRHFISIVPCLLLLCSCASHPAAEPDWAVQAARLHGNMGPGVIAGAIVGHDAMKRLGHPRPWEVQVTLYLPPARQVQGYKCILDGLQSTTGATMGKGNIMLRTASPPPGDAPIIQIERRDGSASLNYRLTPLATALIDQTTYPTMRADSRQFLADPAGVFTVAAPPADQ